MIHHFNAHQTVFNQFIREIRDEMIQKDRAKFRNNIVRMSEIMAYEISKTLRYEMEVVTTPLGEAEIMIPAEQPVICSIMRAALPMHQGFLNIFDRADSAFAAAYRRHHRSGEFEIEMDYLSSPNLEERTIIIVDPMLATGSSIELVYKQLMQHGKPAKVHVAALIASESGLNHARTKLPEDTHWWIGAIDKELTAQAYIVPGLGDAGDLAFGRKV
jgi:uracil phosphoribosyltransferase